MISINKKEATAVREKFPRVYITRTCQKHSDRHHYYCEEAPGAMDLIHKMRGDELPKRNTVVSDSGWY